ncbi:MAG TPA: hypothetical protein VII57_06530 [Dehalococcoidia bacterium]
MRSSWKLLPLAALMALGLLVLLPGGVRQPSVVTATDCAADEEGTLRIRFREGSESGSETTLEGFRVVISPDPTDHADTLTATDEGSNDDADGNVGRIDITDACETDHFGGNYDFTASIVSGTDADDENCDIEDTTLNNFELDAGEVTTVNFVVDCGVATSTPTTTVAAGVTVSSSFATLACNSFSVITVTVRDGGGNPLPNVTLNVAASIGSVSPTQVTTGTGGAATTLYTAPATQGGTATVTATVASTTVSGSTTILINCAATPTATTVPPTATATRAPTTGLGAPSTGDGGLADGGGTGWPVYAGFVLTASALIGGVIAFRVRA